MEPMMEMWLEKANVLIEALPYIQRFHGKTIVVKYGGSAMVDHELKKSVIRDVALLKLVGFRPIIVHGGGKEITKWINKVGLETNFVNGLRVTDAGDDGSGRDGAQQDQQRPCFHDGKGRIEGSRHQRQGRIGVAGR